MKINRRKFVKGTAAGLAANALTFPFSTRAAQTRPNILFIMADDLGYGDLSSFGRPDYETPVLDKLGADGIKLTNTYSNSAICSPTRTALITGRYQYRLPVGLEEPLAFRELGLPESHPTIASEFQAAGYQTALVGKWHLGAAPDYGPLKSGYDHFFGFYPGGIDYFAHKMQHGKEKLPIEIKRDGLWRDDREPVEVEGYATDVFADQTQAYIEEFAANKQPFFISLHFNASHWPWEGPNDLSKSRDLNSIFHPDGGNSEVYGQMVKSLDANVGRILEKLKELSLEDNTIVVFTSDNGGERYSYNWPFLGKKAELLEGGIRVPGIVKWPDFIQPGQVNEQVIISMDWMPTLLAAAGIQPGNSFPMDGKNLLPVLLGKESPQPRKLFWRFKNNEQKAVLDGDWKYLKIAGKEFLFNLRQDQREQANLKEIHQDKFVSLKQDYEAWNKTMLPYPEESLSANAKEYYSDRY